MRSAIFSPIMFTSLGIRLHGLLIDAATGSSRNSAVSPVVPVVPRVEAVGRRGRRGRRRGRRSGRRSGTPQTPDKGQAQGQAARSGRAACSEAQETAPRSLQRVRPKRSRSHPLLPRRSGRDQSVHPPARRVRRRAPSRRPSTTQHCMTNYLTVTDKAQ